MQQEIKVLVLNNRSWKPSKLFILPDIDYFYDFMIFVHRLICINFRSRAPIFVDFIINP